MEKLSKNTKFMALLIFIFASLWVIYKIWQPLISSLTPLFFALIISYLAKPFVDFICSKNIKRPFAVIFFFVMMILALVIILVIVAPTISKNISELVSSMPQYAKNVQNFYDVHIKDRLDVLFLDKLPNSANFDTSKITDYAKGIFSSLTGVFFGTFNFIVNFVLSIVISVYILIDYEKIRKGFYELIVEEKRELIHKIFKEINVVLSAFFKGQLTVALILGIIATAGLTLLKVKYAPLLGILSGILNMVPYFGPIISAVVPTISALFSSPIKALLVLALYVVMQQIDNAFLSPKIIGSKVGVMPLISICAALLGSRLFGIAGLIFAVPFAGTVKAVGKIFIDLYVDKKA